MPNRYYDLNSYFHRLFGQRVHKLSVDAGFTCPNRDGRISSAGCIYCNARGSGTGAHAKGLSVAEQLTANKAAVAKRFKAKKFMAYFQAFSNTYAPLETLKKVYNEALAVPDVVGLAIGTRPDCISESILDLLSAYARTHLLWVEYGLQSIHDQTLLRIHRGHDFACFREAVEVTRKRGIAVCAHVILGLPGETREHMLETARALARMEIEGVKLHLLYVVKDTALETLFRKGGYRCLEQREYVELVCDFLEHLPPEMVIQRLTGDPHRDELVAPAWSLKKGETLRLIQETLESRDSWQGRALGFARCDFLKDSGKIYRSVPFGDPRLT
jgi:radical SAM protein (TIGR01212 family)